MKKITLIIIILTVLFIFSGCDAMLEFFYPEYAEGNSVTIDISISSSDITDYTYDKNIPLYVELYTEGESPVNDVPFRTVELFNEFETSTTLFVPEGSYDIWIWQDDNQNKEIDSGSGEFVLADDKGTIPTIIFSSTSGEETYVANSWTMF